MKHLSGINETEEGWYGTGYQKPFSSSKGGSISPSIVKFKNFSSPNKERTLSNDWQRDQKNDFIDTIGEITDDIFDNEEETTYDEIEHDQDEFDMGLPDELDDYNRQVNMKFLRKTL